MDLVKYAADRFGIDFVGFLDENLMTMDQFSGKTWMKEIARLWIEEGLQPQCVRDGVPHDPEHCRGVHWDGTSHATLCTPEVLKTMQQAGCSHLVYGYETFSPHMMKTIGKGATPATNVRCFGGRWRPGSGPSPTRSSGSRRGLRLASATTCGLEPLGIAVKPFFATPYPGSEWYYANKDRILEQYGGDLEAFLLDLGDATRITAVISKNFNAVELYGLRELMVQRDLRRIAAYEEEWNRHHPEGP